LLFSEELGVIFCFSFSFSLTEALKKDIVSLRVKNANSVFFELCFSLWMGCIPKRKTFEIDFRTPATKYSNVRFFVLRHGFHVENFFSGLASEKVNIRFSCGFLLCFSFRFVHARTEQMTELFQHATQ